MGVLEALEYQWEYLVSFLGGEEKVDQLARESGAFARSRKIKTPVELLRLLMTWAAGGYSLEETAALSTEAEIADVSDVALLKRFRRCREWAGALLFTLLGTVPKTDALGGLLIRIVDATTASIPGSKGTDHRIHLRLDLKHRRIEGIELTDAKGGETLERFTFQQGELVIGDRGYAHRAGLQKVVQAGAYYIVRFPWQNIPLENDEGDRVNLLDLLRTLPEAEPGEFAVQVTHENMTHRCRAVAIRKSEPAAEAARKKILQESRKKGRTIDPRTLEAAGYFFVLTNLSELSPQDVLDLYAMRWHIEMQFKIMKSVIGLGDLPVKDPMLGQTYLITKIVVALIVDKLVHQYESFPPWGYLLAQTSAPESVAS